MNHLTEAQRLVDLLNTLDLRRRDRREPPFAPDDVLANPDDLSAWLKSHDLGLGRQATDADLRVARRLRSGLRAILLRDDSLEASIDQLNGLTGELPLMVQFDRAGRPHPAPASSGSRSGLSRLLVDVLLLGETDAWQRLKMCAAPDCRWVFIDHSRPGSARWCSARACGNRDKTRRYQARHRNSSRATVGRTFLGTTAPEGND
jgi:predicted RNA-binding Zn ribbon-like protein